jgi:hypothetical protein
VESVIARVVEYAKGTSDGWFDLTRQIQRALDLVPSCRDFRDLGAAFDPLYSRVGLPFAMSFCNEVVPKALAVLALTRGSVRETLVASVNMGRDAASVAAIACGIAGALGGADGIPPALVEGLDVAAAEDPGPRGGCLPVPVREEAAQLFGAYGRRVGLMRQLMRNAEAGR